MRRIRMQRVRRTLLVLGVVSALMALSAGVSFADTLDALEGGTTINLGEIAPGGGASGSAGFNVKCTGQKHATHGAVGFNAPSVTLNSGSAGTASEVTATPSATIPNTWPADGTGCGSTTTTPGSLAVSVSIPSAADSGARSIKVQFSSSDPDVSGTLNFTVAYTVSAPAPSDTTPPSIGYTLDPASPDGDNGWYTTNVTLTWTVTENESPSSLVKTGCVDQNITADQAATTYSCSASSDGGAAGPVGLSIKRDATKPQNAVTGVSNGATYTVGSVPAAGCQTTDNLSGVAESATLSVSGGTSNGVGSFTAACNGGEDNAGNSADSASVTYNVHYAGLSGILQPINPDNSSLFSRGKAVPVKFKLAGDEPNGFDYSAWKLERIKVSCTNFDTEDATLESVVENPSNAFRYDSAADQYINNASFKDQAAGTCWKVRVSLDSGQTMDSAIFKLQK